MSALVVQVKEQQLTDLFALNAKGHASCPLHKHLAFITDS